MVRFVKFLLLFSYINFQQHISKTFVYFRRDFDSESSMSVALQLELQTLQSCVDESDADRAREIVGNIAQICLSDVTQRNIGLFAGYTGADRGICVRGGAVPPLFFLSSPLPFLFFSLPLSLRSRPP